MNTRRAWIVDYWLLWLGATVFLSRYPFLNALYALDGDAWGVAAAARHLAATGEYVMSRPPGYPVLEIVYALFWHGGPMVMNGVTALLSALGAVCFALLVRSLGSGRWSAALGALAFAFVPLVYVNSTTCMDYVWGLSIATAALYAVSVGRAVPAALLAGLMVGCRLTNLLLIPPLAIVLWGCCGKQRAVRATLLFLAVSLVVAATTYVPVYLKYGAAFLSFSDMPLTTHQHVLLWLLGPTLGVWSVLGCASLVVGLLSIAAGPRAAWRRLQAAGPRGAWMLGGSLLAILLVTAAYIRLPHEYAYLLPMVPFTLLAYRLLLGTRWCVLMYGLMLAAPFVLEFGAGGLTLEGPVLQYQRQRQAQTQCIRKAFAAVNRLSGARVALVLNHTYRDHFTSYPPVCRDLQFTKPVEFRDALAPEDMPALKAKSYAIYVLYAERWYVRQGCEVGQDASGAWFIRAEDFGGPDPEPWRLTPFDLALLEARLSPDPDASARFGMQVSGTSFYVPAISPAGEAGLRPLVVSYNGYPSVAAFDTRERMETFGQRGAQALQISGQELLQGVGEQFWLVINPGSLHPAPLGGHPAPQAPLNESDRP